MSDSIQRMSKQATAKSSGLSSNWEKQDVITHNDVIDAYLKGKEVGRNEAMLAMQNLFSNNLEKAKNVSEQLYKELLSKGLKINSIRLKADEITNFLALIVADKDDYISDDFRNAFIISRKLKNQNEDESFNISFTFTYAANTLNENCIDSDGFFLKYYVHPHP